MSKSALINRPVVDIWKTTSRDSERISQRVLGQRMDIIELIDEHWCVAVGDDTYSGCVERRFLTEGVEILDALICVPFASVRELPERKAPLVSRLSMGSCVNRLISNGQWTQISFPCGRTGWVMTVQLRNAIRSDYRQAPELATSLFGTPYLWGGSSVYGIDCSGMTQLMYRMCGVSILRDAHLQRSDERFEHIEFDNLDAGDLVFFGTSERVTHVGLHHSPGRFIHSAGGIGVILSEWADPSAASAYLDARRIRSSAPVTLKSHFASQ